MKYALILTVENEQAINNKNTNLPHRYFEKESVNCIKKWRENAGWLKDIKIIVVNPTGDVNDETKECYKKYDVTYLMVRPTIFKEHQHGFFNVHYVGAHLETFYELQDVCLIHIDLDMEILKPLPKDFFDDLWNDKKLAYCGAYSKIDFENQRNPLYSTELSNTDFIVNIPSKFKFYHEMLNSIEFIDSDYNKYLVDSKYREYDREEYSSDHLINKFNIKLIKDYEQGEGYRVQNKDVFFWHEHFYETQNIKLKIQKVKLIKEINIGTTV